MTPDYLCRLVYVLPPSGYNLHRNHDPGVLLMSPKARTKKTLNPLPFTMRSLSSLSTFKRRLKTFSFSKAFN